MVASYGGLIWWPYMVASYGGYVWWPYIGAVKTKTTLVCFSSGYKHLGFPLIFEIQTKKTEGKPKFLQLKQNNLKQKHNKQKKTKTTLEVPPNKCAKSKA